MAKVGKIFRDIDVKVSHLRAIMQKPRAVQRAVYVLGPVPGSGKSTVFELLKTKHDGVSIDGDVLYALAGLLRNSKFRADFFDGSIDGNVLELATKSSYGNVFHKRYSKEVVRRTLFEEVPELVNSISLTTGKALIGRGVQEVGVAVIPDYNAFRTRIVPRMKAMEANGFPVPHHFLTQNEYGAKIDAFFQKMSCNYPDFGMLMLPNTHDMSLRLGLSLIRSTINNHFGRPLFFRD